MCNQYIREWVEYYKTMGFTNILLYDNNFDGEQNFCDVIGDYISDGYVIIEDYRGIKMAQFKAYYHCWEKYRSDYDWIAFFDTDEFLTFVEEKTIEEFLSDEKFREKNAVVINWMCYGDNDIVYNDGSGVLERFKEPANYDTKCGQNRPINDHVKTIVRCIDFKNMDFCTPHCTNIPSQCTASGKNHPGGAPYESYDFSVAYIRHYTTKTAEEYCEKMRIGTPDRMWSSAEVKNNVQNYFFKLNKTTDEKLKLFEDRIFKNRQ